MAKHPIQSKPKTAAKSRRTPPMTRKGGPKGPKRRHGG